MKTKSIGAVVALVLSAAPAFAGPHITAADARKIALARVPGTIVREKLKHAKKKKAKKGAHDHYNIKIAPRDAAKHDMIKKVEIDAETGAILEIKDVKAKSYDD